MSISKPSQEQFSKLIKYYQNRQFEDAEKLAVSITKEFPEHQFAWKVLGVILIQVGRLSESLTATQKSVELNPMDNEAHYNLGVVLKGLDRSNEAEKSYRQAIKLKPDYAEAHSNLGNTLQNLGRYVEAEKSYRQAITLKPDYAEVHNNLGLTLQELGKSDEAESSFKQSIKLKPDFAEAYNNLGITLKELGRLEEAMNSYTKAIELNPHLPESHENLLILLTSYVPHKEVLHPIFKVDQKIKEVYLKENISGMISDDKIIELLSKSSKIIKEHDLKLGTNFTQIYRRNSTNLNCKRHKKIFNKFNIIPKFCFGCYKVQVEPKSIIELIKLFIVFDQIKFKENNTRKCMIETRPKISGFYKGLIYCSNLEEAYQIANYLNIVVKENIGSELHIAVKRGCSEYPFSFPDYKAINKSGAQLMNYNEDWKSIEEGHDSSSSIKLSKIQTPNLSGLNLLDILTIQNWIDYAKGVGDSSVHLLNQNMVFSPKIYEEAKSRIEKYS
jgi:Flp pilus assembly protein TadD